MNSVVQVAVGHASAAATPLRANEAAAPFGPSAGEVHALLFDSWVTDGRRGFFVDAAHSDGSPPFSLYETLWWLRLARRSGRGASRLASGSVLSWIGRGLHGELTSSGLPQVAQLAYTVDTLLLVGAQVNGRTVARTLERVRAGGRYRSGPSATGPDWGSTVLAVRLQRKLGLVVPEEVVTETARALAEVDSRTVTVSNVGDAVSLLEIAADLRDGARELPRAMLARVVGRARAVLARVAADAVWLSHAASLRRAATRLALPAGPVADETWRDLVGMDGGVCLPGRSSPDPQATFYALELGSDVGLPALPPHSRAGWPTQDAVRTSLSASAAALRIARRLRIDGHFREPLRRQLREVWLPALQRSPRPRSLGHRADRANLKLLAALVGSDEMARIGNAPPQLGLVERPPERDLEMLLGLIDVAQSLSPPERLAEVRAAVEREADAGDARRWMIRAAWLELAARLFSSPRLHRKAEREARDLRITPGVYALAEPGADAVATPSLTASAIGTWIERPATPVIQHWAGAGLCGGSRMRTLALVLACRQRDYEDLFPTCF